MDLGSPAQYEQSAFLLNQMRGKNTIGRTDLFLQATLDEIFRMRGMEKNQEDVKLLVKNAKAQYDALLRNKRTIEQRRKSLNPVTKISAYHSGWLLLKAAKTSYADTKSVSEMLRRELLPDSVDTEDVQSVMLDKSNARISGIAIPLDSESQPAQITASYFNDANNFAASQKNTHGKDLFADEHGMEAQADAEHRCRLTSGSAMATSDGGAASSSSRLSGASANNGFSFRNSKVARRYTM